MIISVHLGMHCTDTGKLVRSLRKNADLLAAFGVELPNPSAYRDILRTVMRKLQGAPASPEAQDVVLARAHTDESADRLVLSDPSLICVPGRVFENGRYYDKAGNKTRWVRNVFPDDEVEFFIGIVNPATQIPDLFSHPANKLSWNDFTANVDFLSLRWSDVIARIRQANPDCRITVWCNEDTPFIWPEVMREVAGLEHGIKVAGEFDVLKKIMTRAGMQRLYTYLEQHIPANEIQRRRILSAFLEKYARTEAIDAEIDLPGWTVDLVAQMSQIYDEDVDMIARMPGVHMISL